SRLQWSVGKPPTQIRRCQLLRCQGYEKWTGTNVLANKIHRGYLDVGCRIFPGTLKKPDTTIACHFAGGGAPFPGDDSVGHAHWSIRQLMPITRVAAVNDWDLLASAIRIMHQVMPDSGSVWNHISLNRVEDLQSLKLATDWDTIHVARI